MPPCASDYRGWHTYLVQQYRSTGRKSKYDHESKKCIPCGFSSLVRPAVSISAVSACGYLEACGVRDTVSNEICNDKIELNWYLQHRVIIHVYTA